MSSIEHEKRDSLAHGDEELGGAAVLRSNSEVEKEGGNLLLQVEDAAAAGLKTAADGKTVLVPQPSDDPRDPLNWPQWKKHTILLIVALAAFVGDYQSGSGIPLLSAQAEEWGMTPNEVNEAGNLNVLLLGLGGLVWIPPLYFWGRLPVLFWTQVFGTAMILGSVLCHSFTAYYAFRPLTSLFLTAGQTIGLTFVKDMFYFHEHARKIGIWVCIFLCSPYCGPFFGGFMVNALGDWRPVLWLVFAASCLVLVLICLFGDETWYDRTLTVQPTRPGGVYGRVLNLTGVSAFKERQYKAKVFPSIMRLVEVFIKPVSWVVFVIYALSFMWAVGINITSSILFATPKEAGGYGFNLKTISFLYFTPLVALIIGEIIGHFLNDYVANRYIKKHAGLFKPECRLPVFFGAAVLMIPGLCIVGVALQRQLSVAAVIVGWGMYVVGVMISSVAVTAFLLDCFPSASGEASSLINLARTISGFATGYFNVQWGMKSGYDVSFGIQAAIVGFATLLVAGLMIFGERIRKAGGPLHFSQHH
ncbi:hypothetical protein JCM11641_001075 [Rhodosporidiobolus odoratus]